MKNNEINIIFIAIILFVIGVFISYNMFVHFYNKNKIKKLLIKSFNSGDFLTINNIDFKYNKIFNAFGKNENCALSENDKRVLSKNMGFNVKAYDEGIMNNFFGGTLYSKTRGYEGIKIHHIVFRVYKYNYISIIGKKEYFSISVERHHGSCVWDGKEMHYPYYIENSHFECVLDDFPKTWEKVKEYMFN